MLHRLIGATHLTQHEANDVQIEKEKRSSVDDRYSDDFFVSNIKKDLTDFDYTNEDVEPDTDSNDEEDPKNIRKRETEVIAGN